MKKTGIHLFLVLMLCSLLVVLPATAAPIAGSITITSPNGGEIWDQGTTHDITWRYAGNPGPTVKIVLIEIVTVGKVPIPRVTAIAENIPINEIGGASKGKGKRGGSYQWTVPLNQRPGIRYMIGIISESKPTIRDTSKRYFTIKYFPKITVTSPNGGESWEKGSHHLITWDYSGNPPTTATVMIKLYFEDSFGEPHWEGIKQGVPIGSNGKGSYDWYISGLFGTGTDNKVHIGSKDAYEDMSDDYFVITSGNPLP